MFKKTLLSSLIFVSLVFAQYERPGSTSAQFLKIDVSARGAGLAGAYIAVVEGAEGVAYNPASIARISGSDIAATHNSWFAGINHDFLSLVHNFGRLGALGISATTLYTDEMKVRTPLQPDGTGETFYSGSIRMGLSYARRLTNRVCFGVTLNYIQLYLYDDFHENGYTLDVSTDYRVGMRDWRLALAILNFGQSITFVNEEYPMPTMFTFGSSANLWEGEFHRLKICGSVKKPNDGAPFGQTGMELDYRHLAFLRFGYNIGHEVARFALGAGLSLKLQDTFGCRVDYSYNDHSALGAAHRLGLGISF